MRYEMYNAIALIESGAIRGVYHKMHLPVEENHYFLPGDEAVVVQCSGSDEGISAFLPARDLVNVFPLLRDRRPDAYGELAATRTGFARLQPSR